MSDSDIPTRHHNAEIVGEMQRTWVRATVPQPFLDTSLHHEHQSDHNRMLFTEALHSTSMVFGHGRKYWKMSLNVFEFGHQRKGDARNSKGELLIKYERDVLWLDVPKVRHGKEAVAVTGVYCPASFRLTPIPSGSSTRIVGDVDGSRPDVSFVIDQVDPNSPKLGISEMTFRAWPGYSDPLVLPPKMKELPNANRLVAVAIALASVSGEYQPPFTARNATPDGRFVQLGFVRGQASSHLQNETVMPKFDSLEALQLAWRLHDKSTRGVKGLAQADRERIAALTNRAPNTVKEQLNIVYRMIRKGEWK